MHALAICLVTFCRVSFCALKVESFQVASLPKQTRHPTSKGFPGAFFLKREMGASSDWSHLKPDMQALVSNAGNPE